MASSEVHPFMVEAIESLKNIEEKIGTRSKAQKLKAREFWMLVSVHANHMCHNLQPKDEKK